MPLYFNEKTAEVRSQISQKSVIRTFCNNDCFPRPSVPTRTTFIRAHHLRCSLLLITIVLLKSLQQESMQPEQNNVLYVFQGEFAVVENGNARRVGFGVFVSFRFVRLF
jgi:hypothetical protein